MRIRNQHRGSRSIRFAQAPYFVCTAVSKAQVLEDRRNARRDLGIGIFLCACAGRVANGDKQIADFAHALFRIAVLEF
eukprot:scaffold232859_cov36-Tisochrysis_lutea.AAC.5